MNAPLLTTTTPLDEPTAVQMAALFSALGDPNRLRLIAALLDGEQNVGALAQVVAISESAISHHLRGLRDLRLVRFRKVGRQVFYSLDDDHVAELFRRGLEHVTHG